MFKCTQLVPRKLILIFPEYRNRITEALAVRIQRELKSVYLNAMQTDKLIESAHVPYSIIINKRTLQDGVLELKHFDPRIKEEVHVTNLKERLLLQTGAIMPKQSKLA